MRKHHVKILRHVIFSEDCTKKHQTNSSDLVLEGNVLDLFVKGSPEFADMATNEDPTAQGRSFL